MNFKKMNEDKNKSCAIILNGESIDCEIDDSFIICADGGANLLTNRKPDIIIGDADSINEIPTDVKFLKFDAQKNETDGELCVKYACEQGFKEINFYGLLGGRVDHILGNFALFAYADKFDLKAIAHEKGLDIYFAKGTFKLETKPNDTISVVPFGGKVIVKHSVGLYYPLENLTIEPYQTRGISNIANASEIILQIETGSVLVFHYYS